jgi:hypothetical protein
MAKVNWAGALNLKQAVSNVVGEFPGDWHQDPWGWPELDFMLNKQPELIYENCDATGTLEASLIDIPKENWGTRPAMVPSIADRLTYQALVDRLSVDLIGHLSPNTFGWRLPAVGPKSGEYSRNDKQWEGYRAHMHSMGVWHATALKTDIVSCFASMPIDTVQDAIDGRTAKSTVKSRLLDILTGFDAIPDRSGLPQRSTASAVIANMFLSPLDDVLLHNSTPMPTLFKSKVQYSSFARWMDDIWLFGSDPAKARRAQMELQSAALSLGLHLNAAKTDVLEGPDVVEQALEVAHSAVDDAIDVTGNFTPLEELIDKLLNEAEKASRTSVKFASKRMRENAHMYRVSDLAMAAKRMPHTADAWERLFTSAFTHVSLQDWFLDYAASDWATHEWSVSWYARMFPSTMRTKKALREFCGDRVRDANTSLPLLAVSSQRLTAWDPVEARTAFRDSFRRTSTAHARRVMALSALEAGETRTVIRRWLGADKENYPTLRMLEDANFNPPKVQKDFLGW